MGFSFYIYCIDRKRGINRLDSLLKPCLFCGGKARISDAIRPDGHCSYRVKFVQCTQCHAKTEERTCDGYYGDWCTDEEIADLWNRRAE